ncbi:MAG TPA: type VI secretion system membrane subunit TssM [Allosphingosinicella sp.]|jgi:type VI secretion system protein ImpL
MRRLLKSWWFLTITLALVLILLLTLGLPLFVAFLRPMWVRILLGLLVAAVWALLAFLRVRRARRASAAIAAELAAPSAADEESRALAARMKEALGTLRGASGRRDYLYSRPWYVIIGPPGAGKTTALLNSGLRFPFAEQAMKGLGGTRNLDFWFADEAALVDTAGRYTTQDSDHAVDSGGWASFLSLLKKHRPLQPVNGIIVAISVDELIRSDRAAIDAHAAAVMRRLREIRTTLEVAAPVYVLLTKADLLAGFVEYFDDLDFEGRRAVLGSTLPFAAGKPDSAALAKAFDEMAQAVADRQAKRLFEEVDASRRSLLLGFPAQLQSLRARLMRFLEGAFVSGESGAMLRGFYLTSGVQEGAPLDRILSAMADVYDRPREARPGAAGKAYFLNRLLANVLFEEAGLVQMDPRARTRQRARLAGLIGLIAFTSLITLGAWGVSFARNRTLQDQSLAAATEVRQQIKDSRIDTVEVREDDPDLRQALPILNALRSLPQGYAARQAGGAPLSMRFGLFQAGLSRQSEEAYREGLRRIMLPRLLLRLEKYLRGHAGDAMALYEPLKVYLLLGGQRPGKLDTAAIESWIVSDWAREVYPGADSGPERQELREHLKVLLADENLASGWAGRTPPIDGNLVQSARNVVQTLALGERAYAIMRQKAASAGPPWRLANFLRAGETAAFADADAVYALEVPYFFTRPGFEKTYTLGLATVQRDVEADAWVLGSEAESVRTDISNVRQAVAGLYAGEYIAAWERVVAAMKPADYFNNLTAYGAFTKSPSPLKVVLLELRRNTSFQGGVAGATGRVVNQRLGRSRTGTFIQDMRQGREMGLDAGGQISSYFAELHEYVGDGKGQAPIDDFVQAVKQAGAAVQAARQGASVSGSDSLQAAMSQAVANVRMAAAIGAPPQLKAFLDAATKGGAAAQVSTATGAVTSAYASTILPACREVAQERYPFFATSGEDAGTVDVMRVFGTMGVIDTFLQQRLAPLMERSGPLWRWRSETPVTAGFDPATPEEFAKAAQVRDLLAAGLPLKVAVERMSAETASIEISSGTTTQRLDRDSAGPKALSWSAQGTPEAYIAFQPLAPDAAQVRIEAEGPWALFRLFDKAEKQNSGERSIKATFRSGTQWATLRIILPGEHNPFGRGGLWSFRCPLAL